MSSNRLPDQSDVIQVLPAPVEEEVDDVADLLDEVDVFQILPGNTDGYDYIVPDLHGSWDLLDETIAQINQMPGVHRLFLIGDLVDRGKDSKSLVLRILHNNLTNDKLKIHAVRGNHEEMCIAAMNGWSDYFESAGLEQIMQETGELSHHTDKRIIAHMQNSGEWLLALMKEEYKSGLITLEEGKICFDDDSAIFRINVYFCNLPHMIRVEDVVKEDQIIHGGYNLVHADMPVSDDVLLERVRTGQGFTDEELDHALWARLPDKADPQDRRVKIKKMTDDSRLTYVGHNIVRHQEKIINKGQKTIYLDIGAFELNQVLVVNHTQRSSILLGELAETFKHLGQSLHHLHIVIDCYLDEIHREYIMRPVAEKMHRALEENNEKLMETLLDQHMSPLVKYKDLTVAEKTIHCGCAKFLEKLLDRDDLYLSFDKGKNLRALLRCAVMEKQAACAKIILHKMREKRIQVERPYKMELQRLAQGSESMMELLNKLNLRKTGFWTQQSDPCLHLLPEKVSENLADTQQVEGASMPAHSL